MNAEPVEATSPASNWQIAMQRFAKTETDYHHATSLKDDEARSSASDAYGDARWDLIRMPAPDLPALRWKLDYILEGSNGSIDPWALSSLSQLKIDMQRLMQGGQDDTIKLAWARRLTALRIHNALPEQERAFDIATGNRTPAAQLCWDTIDAADEEIRTATATTVEGARIQLHCAMLGIVDSENEEAALIAGDMEAFAKVADLDFPVQLAFSALRSLSEMEKAA